MKYLIFCLFVIIIIAADCHKDKNDPYYTLTDAFKNFTIFKEGTYWIYKDSITNNFDSLMLTTYYIEKKHANNFNFYYDELRQEFFSSYNNLIIIGTSQIHEVDNNNYYIFYSRLRGNFISGISIGTSNFYFPTLKYVAYYDSIQVLNHFYKEVKVFTLDSIETSFWAKHIGLIKSIVNDSTGTKIWLLDRYHIN